MNGGEKQRMKLTPRLQAIVGKVPPGSRVADIGTDHAYIPVYLLMNRLCSSVIATDNRPGPLLAAEETLELFGLSKIAELRLGNGLAALREQDAVDTIIIAGLGGETIAAILQAGIELIKTSDILLLLQPMTAASLLRKWLGENGFAITEEDIAEEEGDYYEVIVARWTGETNVIEEKLLATGPKLVAAKHPLLRPMLSQRLERLETAIAAAKKSASPLAKDRAAELEEQAEWLIQVLTWL